MSDVPWFECKEPKMDTLAVACCTLSIPCLLFGPMPCAREGIEGVRRIDTFEKVSIALGEYYVPDRRTK